MSFTLTPFSTPLPAPRVPGRYRPIPYISPGEYRAAPTAVGTAALVPGNTSAQASLNSLAQVVARASSMVDNIVYHDNEGSLAGAFITEGDYIRVQLDGSLSVICNYPPIWEVVGMAVGPNPNQMVNLDPVTASALTINGNIIKVPSFSMGPEPVPFIGRWPSVNGSVYLLWRYVGGFPHTSLAASATAGATTISLASTSTESLVVAGLDAATLPIPMVICDPANIEEVVITEMNGLTATLAQPLQYNHTIPTAPDFIRVSAIPWEVEQAAISLTSVLLKLRGTRSQIPTVAMGGMPNTEALARAGALDDYEVATQLLKRWVVPVRRT